MALFEHKVTPQNGDCLFILNESEFLRWQEQLVKTKADVTGVKFFHSDDIARFSLTEEHFSFETFLLRDEFSVL